jgi:proline racemase
MTLKTIDAHAAGEPLRLITEGAPSARGRTMLDKRTWMARHADHVRRALMLEPRGHADMCGALLTEPTSPGSHAGILFMDNGGYTTMSGHGIIAATTIVLEHGLLLPGGDGRTIVFDTPAGTIRARAAVGAGDAGGAGAAGERRRVTSVSYANVPAFVVQGGVDVAVGARRLRADVAFSGAFYAIVDTEAVGIPLDAAHLPELRRAASAVKMALERSIDVIHPVQPLLCGLHGVIFTGPPNSERAALRSVTVFGEAQVDRSAGGNGTAAVMAVVDAMGLLSDDQPFVHESLFGMTFSGRLAGRTLAGGFPAVIAEIEGAAWVTGEHTFVVADDDPLRAGFRV